MGTLSSISNCYKAYNETCKIPETQIVSYAENMTLSSSSEGRFELIVKQVPGSQKPVEVGNPVTGGFRVLKKMLGGIFQDFGSVSGVEMILINISKPRIFLVFFMLSIMLKSFNLSNIKGIERLSNYDEIKNIVVNKEVDYNNYDRKGQYVYIHQENKPFTGVAVQRGEADNIISLFFYENGQSNGIDYSYYSNGQLKAQKTYVDDKENGESKYYYENGKLSSIMNFKNDIAQSMIDYYENGKTVKRMFKSTEGLEGIMTLYFKGNTKIRAESTLIQRREEREGKERINFTANGLSKFYDKKGNLEAILEFDNDSTENMPLKYYYPNGNLRYYTLMGKNPLDFQNKYIEYYDNGQEKQNCNQLTSGSWSCKQYSKDGKFKGEKTGRQRSQSFGNFGINALLGIFNILTR